MSTSTTIPRGLRVSELAGAVGVPPDTIRYYERAGLLPAEAAGTALRSVHRAAAPVSSSNALSQAEPPGHYAFARAGIGQLVSLAGRQPEDPLFVGQPGNSVKVVAAQRIGNDRIRVGSQEHRGLWVPRTVSPYATCAYSWMSGRAAARPRSYNTPGQGADRVLGTHTVQRLLSLWRSIIRFGL